MRIAFLINTTPIFAGDDIGIAIRPGGLDYLSLWYSLVLLTPAPRTLAAVLTPFNLEFDWTVDAIGTGLVVRADSHKAYGAVDSVFSGPLTILPDPPKLTAPHDGETLHAGGTYTFTWTQTLPQANSYRVLFSTDGGQHWALTFVNAEPAAFYDCMTFFDAKRGLALSDPPDGQKFRVIATDDGGYSWHVVDPAGMPPALPGEAAFAASGECITSDHGHRAWFGTGGSTVARVFRSDDRGRTWTVVPTPMPASPSSGINGLAFRGEQRGIAVGGDFFAPTASPNPKVWSRDGGAGWNVAATPQEYRSGVAWVDGHTAVAVGISGSDVSYDGGLTWTKFDGTSLDTVDCANLNACWAAGANGRVAYLTR